MSQEARAFLGRPFTNAGSAIDMDTLESILDAFAAEQTADKDAEIARLTRDRDGLIELLKASEKSGKVSDDRAEALVGKMRTLMQKVAQRTQHAMACERNEPEDCSCGALQAEYAVLLELRQALLADHLGQRLAER